MPSFYLGLGGIASAMAGCGKVPHDEPFADPYNAPNKKGRQE
jgi:hypothetical protein